MAHFFRSKDESISLVTTPGNAKALWDHIKDLFHDNKDPRAITLDGELRSIKLGSLTINAYCTKIKAMADRLANLGEKVSDKNLVMYALNRLDTRTSGLAISFFDVIVSEISIPSPNRQQSLLLSSPQAPPRGTNSLVIP
nr:hybrid signal transduction histidine kinase M [Tanacetum cinerariifolium]